MKIKEIITILEKDRPWVNVERTRDCLLMGNDNHEITKIGVCWVASIQAIEEAYKQGINFIITHENPFYENSTIMSQRLRSAIESKKALIQQGDMTIYRCHDVWDKMPEFGVGDQWAKRLPFIFNKLEPYSMIQWANIESMSLKEVAEKVAKALIVDDEFGVWTIGDIKKSVKKIAIGTGAATDILEMDRINPDVFIVSDDGANNYRCIQYALDQNKSVIIVNHAACEKAGMKALTEWLSQQANCIVEYLEDGFVINSVMGEV